MALLLGGGSRADILSLILLRPIAAIALGCGIYFSSRDDIQRSRALLALLIGAVASVATQIVPLPTALWRAIPGRGLLQQIDAAASIDSAWRPISFTPHLTWNALFSLLPSAAALVLVASLTYRDRQRLLLVFVAFGILGAVIGLLQMFGGPSSPLYFFRISNNEAPIGLFSNRNHAALFIACLFPFLGILASAELGVDIPQHVRRLLALLIAIMLLAIVLTLGSRAGLVLALLSILVTIQIVPSCLPHGRKGPIARWKTLIATGIALGLLLAASIYFSRDLAVNRIVESQGTDELRFKAWTPIAELAWQYFPVGSGAGSFPQVFQVIESDELLNPTYLNHAHNEWLEIPLTMGLPGILLMIAGIALYAVGIIRAFGANDIWRTKGQRELAQAGGLILFLVALASIVDYPLRAPALLVLATTAAAFMNPSPPRRLADTTATELSGN